ncbi:MAG: TonB-dependent receptor [Saprospiraceae bacterium]
MKLFFHYASSTMLLLFLSLPTILSAQNGTISGTVSDVSGDPLIGATVVVSGTTVGTVTDFDGNYSMDVSSGEYSLSASYTGYNNQIIAVSVTAGQEQTIDFTLSEGIAIDEVVVLGTRAPNRTNTDSPVPVDVINVDQLINVAPQTDINSLLHFTAPSFNSNNQTISDGTDHIQPAALRGLGPDQVLVLLNAKRRHQSSLVNVNGTFGRGSVSTDMNTVPAIALKSIEVLRDGAAAQYGSDAIAGVINLRLKEDVNKLALNVTTGANFTSEIGPFEGEQKDVDGEIVNVGANYGLPIGNNGGFINLTGEFNFRGSTNRMQEFSGGIFGAYNGIERIARADGADVSALSLADVQQYAPQVGYFSSEDISAINMAGSLADISGVLGADVTDQELAARGQTRSDYNMRVGQSQGRGGKFFMNMALPLGDNLEFYSYGGTSYREGESGCFYRLPGQSRTTTAIYPNGTVPRINSAISDRSIAGGIRGEVADWNIDLSSTVGFNEFLFKMGNTHNATLGASSPTEFNAGGHSFTQSTSNIDLSQYFETSGIAGINVAFGAEYRFENYQVIPGTELSHGNYDVNGNLINPTTSDDLITRDILGRSRPSGSQCFAGFLPQNFVDAVRNSIAGYADFEFDISEDFLISAAIRAENYSDFGSTFNYKVASRYKLSDNLSLRGAVSTGFRAPSLAQINYNKTATLFELVNGVSVAQEVGTFSNNSRAAKLLGIPQLQEETSQNFSLGFTAKVPDAGLKFTVDAYQVNIDDRVVLTGQFQAGEDKELQQIFEQSGANRAAFFANAINTQTQGIDVVVSHSALLGDGLVLRNDLAAAFTQTEAETDSNGDVIVKASDLLREKGLVGTYFDQQSRIYLEQAVPRTKITLNNSLSVNKLTIYLRNTYFGETTEATSADLSDASIDFFYSPKVITDLSLGYGFSENLLITIGANNLLDVYPDIADPSFQSSGRFLYSRRSPQFGFGGRHLFARLSFTLE